MEYILAPWPWYVVGPLIAFVFFLTLYFGKTFGVSSSLRTMCTIAGAKKYSSFFDFDWKTQQWNLMLIAGAIIGGFISTQFLSDDTPIQVSTQTLTALQELRVSAPTSNLAPLEIFNWENLLTAQGLVFMVLGGFLVGFGTRYAGGCTSGHAISGLSNLQLPSLIAVIGFFIGGLLMTHVFLPMLITL